MEPSIIMAYFILFMTSFIPTFIIEYGILCFFGFHKTKYLLLVFLVNLTTQLFMTFIVGKALIDGGTTSAWFLLFPIEMGITVFETFVYYKKLDSKPEQRIYYGIVANLVTCLLGFFLIGVQFIWIGKVL